MGTFVGTFLDCSCGRTLPYCVLMTTTRQEAVLILYYVYGRTHRQIGQALGISPQASHSLVQRATREWMRMVTDEGVDATVLVEGLLRSSMASATSDAHLGRAFTRQEELADALALRVEQREAELSMYEQWLDADSHLPSHVKRNTYDQWELHYLCTHKCKTPPYEARSLWQYAEGGRGPAVGEGP